MARNKKLNDVELFYLDNNFGKLPIANIAQTLGRTEAYLIETYTKNHKEPQSLPEFPNQKPDLSPVGLPVKNNHNVRSLLGRRMKDGKPVGITVMTEAASEAADEMRGMNQSGKNRFDKCIFRREGEQGSD